MHCSPTWQLRSCIHRFMNFFFLLPSLFMFHHHLHSLSLVFVLFPSLSSFTTVSTPPTHRSRSPPIIVLVSPLTPHTLPFPLLLLPSLFPFIRRLRFPFPSLSFSFRNCYRFTAVSTPRIPRSRSLLNSNCRLISRHAVLPLCTDLIMHSTNMGQTPNAIISRKPAVCFGLQPVCA